MIRKFNDQSEPTQLALTRGRVETLTLMVMTARLPFVKGHGTENDFVLIPDPGGEFTLSAADVAAICNRRAGLGADGILRVVAVEAEPDAAAHLGQARWFMDYRNADGSI